MCRFGPLPVLVAILALAATPGRASTTLDLTRLAPPSARLSILYQPGLGTVARELGGLAGGLLEELERGLGLPPGAPLEIILLNDSDTFSQLLPGGEQFTGFASAAENRVVLDVAKLAGSPFGLHDTLRHELVHIVLGRGMPPGRLPRWLNEGMAQLMSGGVTELLGTAETDTLRRATLRGTFIPLSRLSAGFPRDPNLLLLAYAQSLSVVSYMDTQYGRPALFAVVRRMREGENLEDALLQVTGATLGEIEASWKRGMQERGSWLPYLADRIYWLVFFIGAALAPCGIVQLRRRARRIRQRWEEEEQASRNESGPGG